MSASVTYSCLSSQSFVFSYLCLRLLSVSQAVFFFFFFFFSKRQIIQQLCGTRSEEFKVEKQSLFKNGSAHFEKPDSAVTICEMSVCVGVRECAQACICGLSLSYPCSPERGAAASLHRREGEGERKRLMEIMRERERQTDKKQKERETE